MLRFHISAKEVHLVVSADTKSSIGVRLDAEPISQINFRRVDIGNSSVKVKEARLYKTVKYPKFTASAIMEINVPAGVPINVFKFGS